MSAERLRYSLVRVLYSVGLLVYLEAFHILHFASLLQLFLFLCMLLVLPLQLDMLTGVLYSSKIFHSGNSFNSFFKFYQQCC